MHNVDSRDLSWSIIIKMNFALSGQSNARFLSDRCASRFRPVKITDLRCY